MVFSMSGKKFKLKRKEGLYLDDAGHKGRGVFCSTDIKKGEVLEWTPTLILNDKESKGVEETILANYVFQIGGISKKLRAKHKIRNIKNATGVIMGIISYFNHDDKPNAEVEWEEFNGTLYHFVKALKNIPKNTEICTSYGKAWFADREI
jgi:SET domain-containing protein